MNVRFKPDADPSCAGLTQSRMQPLARLPVFLALEGKRAVVAGGTAAAAWKAELVAAAGASVDVYAETFCEELRALGEPSGRTRIDLHARAWQPKDLTGAAVAIGDFGGKDEAARFAQAARAAGVLVNVIDKPVFCDFSFGAIVNRSPLVIGISTDGAAPALAQAIRTRLETLIPHGFARWAAAAQRWRVRMSNYRLSFAVRRRFWQNFASVAMAQPEREPQPAFFAELLDRSVRDDAPLADVTVISPVPHDPELLTLRAVRALACADVLLIEADVAAGVLDFARREAESILVRGLSAPEIAAHMRRLAGTGKRVVRLGAA
jgi:uroporphyrin-III C-methyltransferase / precorrin-2 dehydrogenase / sirohydrochlorin ferrochelatase